MQTHFANRFVVWPAAYRIKDKAYFLVQSLWSALCRNNLLNYTTSLLLRIWYVDSAFDIQCVTAELVLPKLLPNKRKNDSATQW